jgi:hypothetical protein
MKVSGIFLIIMSCCYGVFGQVSDKFPFQALVAHEVYKSDNIKVESFSILSRDEVLVVHGFLSLVHISGYTYEFQDTTIHLATLKTGKQQLEELRSLYVLQDSEPTGYRELMSRAQKRIAPCVGSDQVKLLSIYNEKVNMNAHETILLRWGNDGINQSNEFQLEVKNVLGDILFTTTMHGTE